MLILAIFLSFIVLGAHLRLPLDVAFSSSSAPSEMKGGAVGLPRLWGLTAAPLLLTIGILWIFVQLSSPDFGLGGGFERPGSGLAALPAEVKLVAILFVTLLITDLMVLFGGRSFDANTWRVIALLGLVATVGSAYGWNATALRIESTNVVHSQVFDGYYVESGAAPFLPGGPVRSLVQALLLATVSFASAGLLVGPLVAHSQPETDTATPPAAGIARFVSILPAMAVVLYLVTVPTLVRSALIQHQDHLSALSAAALLLIGPWLPKPLRWPSLAAATLLMALFLSRIVVLT